MSTTHQLNADGYFFAKKSHTNTFYQIVDKGGDL